MRLIRTTACRVDQLAMNLPMRSPQHESGGYESNACTHDPVVRVLREAMTGFDNLERRHIKIRLTATVLVVVAPSPLHLDNRPTNPVPTWSIEAHSQCLRNANRDPDVPAR